ncbi:MAG: LPS assembly lipoprotein LptE [Pseudomonadota bacterium]
MRRLIVPLLALILTQGLAACGFQLRGSYSLPWQTLHLGMGENTPMYQQIKRSIEASTQTRIVANPKEAQASLVVTRESKGKSILSLNAAGRVREFQLSHTFEYRILDANGKELVPASQIILLREMTFDDAQLFAKEAEEGMIRVEMQNDIVQQLLRRLSAGGRAPKS